MPSVPLRMPAPPRHGQSSEPACARAGLGRAATSWLVVSAHRRPCGLVFYVDLRPRHFSPLCVTGTTLRIAVGGSSVIEASRHLRFGPVGVARYLLAGTGSDPLGVPTTTRSGTSTHRGGRTTRRRCVPFHRSAGPQHRAFRHRLWSEPSVADEPESSYGRRFATRQH